MFQTFYTTAMCPQRRALEKRFCNIRKSRFASKSAALTGILLAVLLFGSSVFASGMMQNALQEHTVITVTKDAEPLSFVHPPFAESGVVYLPLRELLNRAEIEDTNIRWSEDTATGADVVQVQIIGLDSREGEAQYRYTLTEGSNHIPVSGGGVNGQESTGKESLSTNASDIVLTAGLPVLRGDTFYVPAQFFCEMQFQSGFTLADLGFSITAEDREGNPVFSYNTDFTPEEIAAARAVVEEYFSAKHAKSRERMLATLTDWYDAPNVVLFQNEQILLTSVTYNPSSYMRRAYVENGRGSVNGTSMENVITFLVDYTVSFPDGVNQTPYQEGGYTDWNMILVREDKDSPWLIDDQGY